MLPMPKTVDEAIEMMTKAEQEDLIEQMSNTPLKSVSFPWSIMTGGSPLVVQLGWPCVHRRHASVTRRSFTDMPPTFICSQKPQMCARCPEKTLSARLGEKETHAKRSIRLRIVWLCRPTLSSSRHRRFLGMPGIFSSSGTSRVAAMTVPYKAVPASAVQTCTWRRHLAHVHQQSSACVPELPLVTGATHFMTFAVV
jgi:hypothetical protein